MLLATNWWASLLQGSRNEALLFTDKNVQQVHPLSTMHSLAAGPCYSLWLTFLSIPFGTPLQHPYIVHPSLPHSRVPFKSLPFLAILSSMPFRLLAGPPNPSAFTGPFGAPNFNCQGYQITLNSIAQ